jgi:Family of unknown function (DUF5681)
MAKDKIGYGNPPKSGQFRPGVSGNPKGRPKRKGSSLAERIGAVLDTPIRYVKGATARTIYSTPFVTALLSASETTKVSS